MDPYQGADRGWVSPARAAATIMLARPVWLAAMRPVRAAALASAVTVPTRRWPCRSAKDPEIGPPSALAMPWAAAASPAKA